MARITVEDCLQKVGEANRFNLIHLAVTRIKQHRQGEPYLVNAKNKEVVMTLREIASGDVTFANVEDLPGSDNTDDDQILINQEEGAES
jgi:DNA-directed RNA polymerase subunit omega